MSFNSKLSRSKISLSQRHSECSVCRDGSCMLLDHGTVGDESRRIGVHLFRKQTSDVYLPKSVEFFFRISRFGRSFLLSILLTKFAQCSGAFFRKKARKNRPGEFCGTLNTHRTFQSGSANGSTSKHSAARASDRENQGDTVSRDAQIEVGLLTG